MYPGRGSALNRLWQRVQARREAQQPVFLPFLLVSASPDVGMAKGRLWQLVDESIAIPIEKAELHARVEILLRSRRLSVELFHANQRLQNEIADRQKAEAALRQSEEEFRKFIEAAPDAIVIMNNDGKIILVNAQTEQLFGYQRSELIGLPLETLLPDRFRKVHVQHRTQYASNPQLRPMGAGLDLYARLDTPRPKGARILGSSSRLAR